MNDLTEFATRYAAAWSSQNPAALASFYAEHGSLQVNDGQPAVGRAAIAATARDFMAAFPDMVVRLVELRQRGDHVEFHWHWTGTNTGPGGTGRTVDLRGFERWTLDDRGLILESLGHMDDAEYQRPGHRPSRTERRIRTGRSGRRGPGCNRVPRRQGPERAGLGHPRCDRLLG